MCDTKDKHGTMTDEANPETLTIRWLWSECTHHAASGFNRMSKTIERESPKRVVLDMSECRFLNVTGLRYLLEWNADLLARGVELRVTGLSPMLLEMFRLSRLEWLLADDHWEN